MIAGGALATLLALAAVAVVYRTRDREARRPAPIASATSPAPSAIAAQPAAESYQGLLYGRVTTVDGATYEGRLRWGVDQEAFWNDSFNGYKQGNPWLAHVAPGRLPKQRDPIVIFGIEIAGRERPLDLGRQFMEPFGELVRIEARPRDLRVTLKSGAVVDLDRFKNSDFDDGVRVWHRNGRVFDLDSQRIRSIDLLPTPALGTVPDRLYGTVHTRQGDFTGFIGWDREQCFGHDQLVALTGAGPLRLRFDAIRSLSGRPRAGSLVTLSDGREIVLSKRPEIGPGNHGIHVDDPRFGRVLIHWNAFERVDFGTAASGPAYAAFPPGRPLTGSVTTRAGRRLAGRLVYDLDESETSETLDADAHGIHYAIPFGLVASIAPAGVEGEGSPARVTLRGGEELRLEASRDLAETNGGALIFVAGQPRPEYVPWGDVGRVDLDQPPPTVTPKSGP